MAEWQAEQRQLHSVAIRHYPLNCPFSGMARDIFFDSQPLFYPEGIGFSAITFKPFAKLRLASSFTRLHIDLGDSLKRMSKNQRRKALRYGKLAETVKARISETVRHYLANS